MKIRQLFTCFVVLGLMATDASAPRADALPSRPPAAAEQPAQTVRLVAVATCTARACPGDSCCNACGFGGWMEPKRGLEAVAGKGTEALPRCEVDGCGRCAFDLTATGRRRGEAFVVKSWSKVPTRGRR